MDKVIFPIAQEFRETLLAEPFPSPLLQIEGFAPQLVWPDPLHVAFRGFAANWAASCIQDMFPMNQMEKAFDMLQNWARATGAQLAMDDFTFGDDGGFPTLNCKGWDVKLVCLFLDSRSEIQCRFLGVSP